MITKRVGGMLTSGVVKKTRLLTYLKNYLLKIFGEIHRVMASNAVLEFIVPVAGSDNYFTDPTHTMPFTPRTMDFLTEGKPLRENGIIYGAAYEFRELSSP